LEAENEISTGTNYPRVMLYSVSGLLAAVVLFELVTASWQHLSGGGEIGRRTSLRC
jgi:hypothetical protein